MQDNNGEKGDQFFEAIEEITTQWPFTVRNINLRC